MQTGSNPGCPIPKPFLLLPLNPAEPLLLLLSSQEPSLKSHLLLQPRYVPLHPQNFLLRAQNCITGFYRTSQLLHAQRENVNVFLADP